MKKLLSLLLVVAMLLSGIAAFAETAVSEAINAIGKWISTSAESEGMVLDQETMEMYGMYMEFTLNTDGTASMLLQDEVMEGLTWAADDTSVSLTMDGESLVLPFNEQGGLTLDMEGTLIYFEKLVVGVWNAVSAEADGMTLDASMLEMMGLMIKLTLNADGTGSLEMEGEAGEISWMEADGVVTLDAMGDTLAMTLNEDATMSGDFGGVIIIFAKEGGETTAASSELTGTVEDFYGDWTGMFGDTLSIYADGTLKLVYPDGEIREMTWEMQDGAFTVTSGNWWGEVVTIEADGSLKVGENPMNAYSRSGAGSDPAGSAAVAGTEEDFIGVWNASVMETEGMTMDVAAMGMVMDLTIDADGTITLYDGESAETGTWTLVDGMLDIMGIMQLALTEDGRLCMEDEGARIYFVRGEASEVPANTSAEVDTSALIGTWFDGDTTNFTINADGTCVATDQYGDSMMEWEIVDGVPMITSGFWFDSPMILNEDGTLYVSDGWSVDKTFTFGAGEIRVGSTLEDPSGTVAAASADAFFGEWKGESMVMESGTFALSDFGMTMDLTIGADGTLSLFDGAFTDSAAWTFADGILTAADGMIELSLMEDGKLCMAQEFQILYLVRAEGGEAPVETPAASVAVVEGLVGIWTDGDRKLEIRADGTGVYTDPWGYIEDRTWTATENGCAFTDFWWEDYTAVLESDGSLTVSDGSYTTYYMHREGEVEAPVEIPAEAMVFIGEWDKDDNDNVLCINPDGTMAFIYPDGDTSEMTWNINDGGEFEVTSGVWEGYVLKVNDSDVLKVGMYKFNRISEPYTAAPVETPEATEGIEGTEADFIGIWNGTVLETEGMTMGLADIGMLMQFVVHDNGIIDLYDGDTTESAEWTIVDGKLDIMGAMQLCLTDDGRLFMAEDEAVIYFERGEEVFQSGTGEPEAAEPVYADMEDFVGLWFGKTVEMDGQVLNLSDLDMVMEIELDANGNITLFDGEVTETGLWNMVDGQADIDGMILTLMSDGTVVAEDPDGAKVVFTGFAGIWKACYMDASGLNGDLRSMGISSTLVLNADGTGSIDFPTPEEGSWYREDGVVRFGEYGMQMELLSGGFLKYGTEMSGYMVFSQDENAVWVPGASAAVEMPVATDAPVIDVTPVPTQAPANEGANDLQARMNRKYVATTYTAYGQTMDGSMLGEYSLFFRENGTCDFGMGGMVVPNLPWGLQKVATGLTEVDAFVINYYGSMFNAVITDAGFDMDFYGTMVLHFVPVE